MKYILLLFSLLITGEANAQTFEVMPFDSTRELRYDTLGDMDKYSIPFGTSPTLPYFIRIKEDSAVFESLDTIVNDPYLSRITIKLLIKEIDTLLETIEELKK